MEINQDPPKKVKYSIALYNNIGKKGFWTQVKNIGKKLAGRNPNYYTKSELKDFLHHKNSSSANNFLQELEEDGILVEKGKRDKNGKPVETYDLKREKLLKEFMKTEFMSFFMGRKQIKYDSNIISEIFLHLED